VVPVRLGLPNTLYIDIFLSFVSSSVDSRLEATAGLLESLKAVQQERLSLPPPANLNLIAPPTDKVRSTPPPPGTVSRDFLPSVFFVNRLPLGSRLTP
jgi:hypothetical protein